MRVTKNFVFFWGSIFSNFYPYENKSIATESVKPLNFEADGNVWKTSEQYFMWLKAMHFEAYDIAKKIEKCERPEQAKSLGRKIKNFDDEEWAKASNQCMYKAVFAKFSQCKELKEELLSPKYDGKEFVEASPLDKIWGIGLHFNDRACDNRENWLGQNKLGKVINKVREDLKK